MNSLDFLNMVVATGTGDNSENPKDALIYAVTVGWDPDSYSELSVKFNWDSNFINNLKNLRTDYIKRSR